MAEFSFSLDHAVNWKAISAIGQLVDALAVFISLIYLASEGPQEYWCLATGCYRSTSDAFNRWSQNAEHPHLTDVYYRGIHDIESLEGANLGTLRFSHEPVISNVEEMYYLQLKGHLDPRVWRGWEAGIREFSGYPGVQAF